MSEGDGRIVHKLAKNLRVLGACNLKRSIANIYTDLR